MLPPTVTVVPGAPLAGEKLSIVGPVPEAITEAAATRPATLPVCFDALAIVKSPPVFDSIPLIVRLRRPVVAPGGMRTLSDVALACVTSPAMPLNSTRSAVAI